MTTLDYQQTPRCRTRWARRLLIAFAVAIFLAILIPVIWATASILRLHADSRRFHDAYPESQIRGQSPAQIITRFGPPYIRETRPDGLTLIYANSATWEYCGIEFQNDRATRVFFWGK